MSYREAKLLCKFATPCLAIKVIRTCNAGAVKPFGTFLTFAAAPNSSLRFIQFRHPVQLQVVGDAPAVEHFEGWEIHQF